MSQGRRTSARLAASASNTPAASIPGTPVKRLADENDNPGTVAKRQRRSTTSATPRTPLLPASEALRPSDLDLERISVMLGSQDVKVKRSGRGRRPTAPLTLTAPATPRVAARPSRRRISSDDSDDEDFEPTAKIQVLVGDEVDETLSDGTSWQLSEKKEEHSESDLDDKPLAGRRRVSGGSSSSKAKGKAPIITLPSDSDLSEIDLQSSEAESIDLAPVASSSSAKPKRKPGAKKVVAKPARKRPVRKAAAIKSSITELNTDEEEVEAGPQRKKGKKPARRSRIVSDDDSGSEFNAVSSADDDSAAEDPAAQEDEQENDEDAEAEEAAAPRRRTRAPRGTRAPARGAAAAARREATANKAKAQIFEHHPELVTVWEVLEKEMEVITPELAPQPADIMVKLLPFQQEGLFWMTAQEESRFAGGILADEMGMGKTIQMISLLVTKKMKPNLILTPTVAIMQWLAELRERTTPGSFKILLYHGANRPDTQAELEDYDIVLSTYAIVEQGWRRERSGFTRKGANVKEPSLLHAIPWARVILDEAHAIKDRSCSTARAVFNLKRQKQWSLSGTPLQNRVGELYSLIRFMNADPFSYYFCKKCPCKMQTWSFSNNRNCDGCGHISHQHFCWWNAEILKPIQRFGAEGEGLVAFKKLGALLDRIMLRRTKLERTEELGLPPRVVTVRRDVFNEAEEELYESLYSDSARTFSTYVQSSTVLNNYASIFSLLSRMRLAVNHPDLVTTRLARDANTATETLVCGICNEEAEDAIMSKCKHVFCREDARQYIQSSPDGDTTTCPICFKPLTIDLSAPEYVPKDGSGDSVKRSIVNYIDMAKWRSSSKIEALVEELTSLQRDDSTAKSIVFSQFVAFLDLVQWRLSRAGFRVVKLDGRMAPMQRDTVIKQFMTDPAVTVFLVSLKAGGVALNLTEASRVFVCDPWWNPACEDQAFDRIHRLGQYRPIKITRLIIENSIESRILQLQEKKKALFASTVGRDVEALAKLSEEDLQFLFVL
ncbi:DNA repair protein rad16 [Thoreauomyces humboldtii]|nr:DNA repair protein rad16 [Thoreauomyces humboldtii]